MFWEDHYRKNPTHSHQTADGQVIFANTGDPLIDKWEKELAQGLTPDLLDGVPLEEREAEARALEKLKTQQRASSSEGVMDGFSDDYLSRRQMPLLGK